MNVLINGSSGFIGYHLTRSMLEAGHRVYAVCRGSHGHLEELKEHDGLQVIDTQQDGVREKIRDIEIDTWYQLLWDGAVGEKRADPVLQEKNVIMYLEALRTAEELGVKKIIYTGTVYEHFAESILKDEASNPHSFYVLAKKQAHDLTYQYSKNMKIQYVWVNFCHPVGKYMNPKQLFPYAIEAFTNKKETSFGKCDKYFDIIPVTYLANALRILGEKEIKRNMYYIGSGDPRLLKEYIARAADVCGYKGHIGFGMRKDDGLVFEKEWFDTSDLVKDTGLRYNDCLDEVIREMSHELIQKE